MSKKADKGEEKQPKKDKKGKRSAEAGSGLSIAGHSRASYHVRRAKGWGGLAGFAMAAYLSYKAGVPTFDLGVRAVAAGIAGYMLAWACAVTIWRHLVLAELRAAADRAAAPDPDLIPARAAPARNATAGKNAAEPAAASTGAPAGS